MRKFFHLISYMGLEDSKSTFETRVIVMANRMNFVMLVLMILLNVLTAIMRNIENTQIGIGTLKLLMIIAVNLLNIWLAYKRYFLFFKISLIYLPVFFFFVFPSLAGYNEEEGFYYFSYAIIAFSIIPQLIWLHNKEKTLIICSLIYYLVLIFMADNLLTMFTEEEFRTSAIIKDFYVYYKIAPIAIFLFLHFAIYYLRRLNYTYEKEIMEYNMELNATIEELKTTQQHLIQAEKMASLGTLTAGVAHEINNPLNYIVGGIEMNNDIRQEFKEYLTNDMLERCEEANRLIYEGFDRVSGIVKALMSFSYSGEPRLIESDINELIDNTLIFLGSKMPDELHVEKNYQYRDKTMIYRDKMHQVIINILNNAIDAVKENKGEKRIWISTRKDNNDLILEISNNGPKIPENQLNQLFDPFFTTKDPGKGIGLGLSISYSFVTEHNGNIEVINLDNGITFRIRIPQTS